MAGTAGVHSHTGSASLGTLFEAATGSTRTAHGQSVLVDVGERVGATAQALVSARHGTASATIASSELETIDAIDRSLAISWSAGPGAALTHENGGQLILWHGPPGTGKTHALRALGWEWRHWCDVEYVIDPDVFFGSRADYMVEVLLDGGDRSVELGGGCSLERGDTDESERWRLLVLEDTGELLSADAKERTGQGLSRLLNLVDGIVGQGMRLLVLVTTNEPLRHLQARSLSRPPRSDSHRERDRTRAPARTREWHHGTAMRVGVCPAATPRR